MRLLVSNGRLKATLQHRPDGSQSQVYCCDEGHDNVEDAARHGAEIEVRDEIDWWLRQPQPKVIDASDDDEPEDWQVAGGHRPVFVFDKRLLAEENYPHMTQTVDGVDLLGVTYQIVHETAAALVGVRPL